MSDADESSRKTARLRTGIWLAVNIICSVGGLIAGYFIGQWLWHY